MIKKLNIPLWNLALTFIISVGVYSMDPPHDSSNNISCGDCHATHKSGGMMGGALVPRGEEQEALCKSCHNPTGQASEMSDVSIHKVNGGELVIDCGSCHEVHSPPYNDPIDPHTLIQAPNLSLIRANITKYIPEALELSIFQSKPENFAFSTPIFNGICQTCHTETSLFRNDSFGLDQLHTDFGVVENTDCANCHTHRKGFQGMGGGAHPVHISGINGPQLACVDCHGTNSPPLLSDSLNLFNTSVCDACHSPNGFYDGVNDPDIGAKPNWGTGVYESDELVPGKEKWCAGCHDDAPSLIQNVAAPNVVGNEAAGIPEDYYYGTGYGYYKTGHGREFGTYPATGASAANLQCSACHDLSVAHIDGIAQTYAAVNNNYQEGYRLKDVNSGPPMDIPRLDWNIPDSDFALCLQCHDRDPLLEETNMNTNFRDQAAGRNDHYRHLIYGGDQTNRWDSDWDGIGDSQSSCVACHNVHGSTSPRMIRHGELISTPGSTPLDKVPGLNFFYKPDIDTVLADSTGGWLDLPFGAGSIENSGVCVMCHSTQGGAYQRDYIDLDIPEILSVYGLIGSDLLTVTFSKPVYSQMNGVGDLTTGDFIFTDSDNIREILSISHTAGDSFCWLTLSTPLDNSEDLNVDTLAAASDFSIYGINNNAMNTTEHIVRAENDLPQIHDQSPANNATDVSVGTNLSFLLTDDSSGINTATLVVHLSGNNGYSQTYTELDSSVLSLSGLINQLTVEVNPDVNFDFAEDITVSVVVQDLAGNALLSPAWSFLTVASVAPQTLILHPSNVNSDSSGFFWPVNGIWADVLDTNDGNSSYVTSNTGGPNFEFSMDMDDPSGIEDATIQSLKIYILTKYVIGWVPNPSCIGGTVNIGYTTGSLTRWNGNQSVPNTDCIYQTLSSSAFTTDSDSGNLDITDITNLQINIKRITGGGYPLRITEGYVEVTYLPALP